MKVPRLPSPRHCPTSWLFPSSPSPTVSPTSVRHRPISTTSLSTNPNPKPGIYLYELDHHGQLFLSGTKIRNFTSCYKDKAFLDFFYRRLRRNDRHLDLDSERYRKEGYEFVSPCGKEVNYLKADDSAVVYQKLEPEGLLWAGTLVEPFQPDSLLVDPESGYLYHPSPSPLASRRRTDEAADRYGAYSLLRSSLVLDMFARSLELDDKGGAYTWEGQRRTIGTLEKDQVFRSLLRENDREPT